VRDNETKNPMISKAASFDGLFDGKCEWKKIFVDQYQTLRRSVDTRVGVIPSSAQA
jgi:hypothetical protein